ncbi:putative bacterioferritin comigratory protein [Calothrix sp. NIES-4071]|nr:putative bacterioferritin comigratory protein [Calothrix sp. NIES-4071]BAZ57771.1 putative bacterioferritin comigratory protein [Calothrix sp. NIES-4105]
MNLAMNLKEMLDAFRAEFLEKLPSDKAAIMQRATDVLEQEFAYKKFLQLGDSAPDFTLPNAVGKTVRLSDYLSTGPVILTFYRGGWCPYCNLELRAYQQMLPQIQALGASLIAVSPQAPDASLSTAEKNNLAFDVLSDVGSKIAHAYGIAFELPSDLKALYTELNHALPGINGTDDWTLPIPATFVIDQNQRIALAHIDIDYRNRLEPAHAIAKVQRLSRQMTAV